ncbi:hypothetical protein [Saccharopolyspora sp. 5N708]|uniref:hypothetical protein n=1 Tax=Saccharopolyspora sp. 5N708 TaxID=3457424 RepID=UPI003FD59B93
MVDGWSGFARVDLRAVHDLEFLFVDVRGRDGAVAIEMLENDGFGAPLLACEAAEGAVWWDVPV